MIQIFSGLKGLVFSHLFWRKDIRYTCSDHNKVVTASKSSHTNPSDLLREMLTRNILLGMVCETNNSLKSSSQNILGDFCFVLSLCRQKLNPQALDLPRTVI